MPTVPNLISPTPVVIEQTDQSTTRFDDLAREPVKYVKRSSSVTINAQISWGKSFSSRYQGGGQGGTINDATGYLVFRVTDLTTAGVTLKQGDKVTQIGGLTVNVWLTDKTWVGHHDGAPTLELWDMSDRPLKARR